MAKFKDLTGQRFGRLIVIKQVESHRTSGGHLKVRWLCKCDCSNTCIVNACDLTSEHSKSCGCLNQERNKEKLRTHGYSKELLYKKYNSMKRRCYNEHEKSYKDYGGRGIKVCDEWLNDYVAFREWALTNDYQEGLSIDRIDVNGNYEPTNCRWVNKKIQNNNTRRNHYMTINGETHTLAEWSEISGINYGTLKSRVYRGLVGDELLKK